MEKRNSSFIPAGLVMLTMAAGLEAGTITGRAVSAVTGKGLKQVPVRVFAHGQSVATGKLTEGDGSFAFCDLDPGSYAICVPSMEGYRPGVISDLRVREDSSARAEVSLQSSIRVEGDSWMQSYPSLEQSFTASGLGITDLGVKAFGTARTVEIQVREGADPAGANVGPVRVTQPVGGEATDYVSWGGAEVPTQPGSLYTLDMSAMGGETWVPGVAGRGDVYPGGRVYFDGVPRPFSDFGICIAEDNDGWRTSYALSGGRLVVNCLKS